MRCGREQGSAAAHSILSNRGYPLSTAEHVTAQTAQRLGVDERLALLVDPDSSLEVAAQARSQQPSVAADTPADGVRTLLARVNGFNVAVIAENGPILERTDGEVARAKRHRILDLARITGVPVILLLDGPGQSPDHFDPNAGELAGHMSDPRLDVDLRQRVAPLIGVVCGPVVGWASAILGECDLVITSENVLRDLDNGVAAAADIIAACEPDAIRQAVAALTLLIGGRTTMAAAGGGLVEEEWITSELTAAECGIAFVDSENLVPFASQVGSTSPQESVTTGLATLGGWPITLISVGGTNRAVLGNDDLRRIARIYRLSRRNRLPLLVLQNCAGLDSEAIGSYELLAKLLADLRESDALKVNVVTGAGHALGTFPLGSRQLGVDYFVAWPWADLSITDPQTDYSPESLDSVRADGPWLAAGRGLIDDILSPAESVEAVRWIVDLYMSNRDGADVASSQA
jgi:acetyl-CoA carboxylase carboxyltransferase component